jgi:hypothetical protein
MKVLLRYAEHLQVVKHRKRPREEGLLREERNRTAAAGIQRFGICESSIQGKFDRSTFLKATKAHDMSGPAGRSMPGKLQPQRS